MPGLDCKQFQCFEEMRAQIRAAEKIIKKEGNQFQIKDQQALVECGDNMVHDFKRILKSYTVVE